MDIAKGEISNLQHEKMRNLIVLIVEDDESARFYLNEVLKSKCKKIINAKTGLEAVNICKEDNTIGLILMDIKLPDLDGYEATRQIRQFNKKVKIVGQTAYALIGDRSKVIEAGCDDYLSKPINKTELFQIIDKHI